MTTVDLVRIGREIIPPIGAGEAIALVEHELGDRLPTGTFSGRGGRTRYRIGYLVDGLRREAVGPAFDRPRDALRLVGLLNGGGR